MSLRDRKRARTRQALVDAATELFASKGYEATTIADIAAAAEIGTRTFFSYFSSKDELLFPEADLRVSVAVDAIGARRPGETPREVLLRGLREASTGSDDLVGSLAALRNRLALESPAVQGRALRLQVDAQREIARHLHEAYPEELTAVTAAALVGAFVGAITGAMLALQQDPDMLANPDRLRTALEHATDMALKP